MHTTREPRAGTLGIAVHPATVLYSGVYRQQNSETGFQVGLSSNWSGGNDGQDVDFCASRNNGIGNCAGAGCRELVWFI